MENPFQGFHGDFWCGFRVMRVILNGQIARGILGCFRGKIRRKKNRNVAKCKHAYIGQRIYLTEYGLNKQNTHNLRIKHRV